MKKVKSGFYWDTWFDCLVLIDGVVFWRYYERAGIWDYLFFNGLDRKQDRFEYIEGL